MSSFTDPLIVRKLKARMWKVEQSFTYYIGKEDSDKFVIVPKGFETDFASVPRLFWVIFPPDGRYTQAAVLHDFLYFKRWFTRKESDRIFLEAMKVLKVPFWKRAIMHMAVRSFGWIPWNNKKRK